MNFKRTHQTEICQWPGNRYFIEMYAIRTHLLSQKAEKKHHSASKTMEMARSSFFKK